MANTTWSATDKTASVALTNANLTATVASATNQGIRTADRQITGKLYFEYTFNGTPGNICCGIASPSAVLSTLGAAVASGLQIATVQGNGVTIVNGVQTVSMGGFANGGVACLALDLTNQLLWFRNGAAGQWNASATANPATGAGGLAVSFVGGGIPAYGLMNTGTVVSQGVTANFGDSAFAGAVPAGFTSGFTAGATIATNALASQIALEEWGSGTPAAQLTQVAIEEWATVAEGPLVVPDTGQTARVIVLA